MWCWSRASCGVRKPSVLASTPTCAPATGRPSLVAYTLAAASPLARVPAGTADRATAHWQCPTPTLASMQQPPVCSKKPATALQSVLYWCTVHLVWFYFYTRTRDTFYTEYCTPGSPARGRVRVMNTQSCVYRLHRLPSTVYGTDLRLVYRISLVRTRSSTLGR